MDNEFIKEWLKWVIDFIQMDLSKFEGRHKLFQRLSWIASSNFYSSFDPFGKSKEFSYNQMKEWDELAPDIQNALREFINQMVTTHATYDLPDVTMSMRPEGTMTRDPRVYFQTRSIPKDPTPKNWAILNLSRLIQGLEMHVVKKCEGCQRYFLNFSLRKRVGCSHKCSSKILALTRKQRWSEKKYRLYLDKQKKRVLKKYVEKRKAQKKEYRPRAKKRGSKRVPKMM
jgi:hypothetical protein